MNKVYFLLILLSLTANAFAQKPSRVTISGVVQDTSGENIPLPTVMLLKPSDSTLINFTRGDENGAFRFKNVANNDYLLKVSYVGYIPYQQFLPASNESEVELGPIGIKEINTQLMEVVIKTAKSTLSIRGDTIEYDASSFKVPPGSTVEDLLRRLPGIEVDADGNIKAQGQDVRRVFVDGKTFFGDDPKAATKNLGAETISKVQVYDGKSEQAQLTGVDDGKKEKTMNLELKEEYKKGAFGKITAAAGTEERWALRGNYNRFNSKEQLSFIGFANNINETGVNWEDYREFQGQSAYTQYDNGDFGFGSGSSGRYTIISSGGGPVNRFDGRGFTRNFGGGTNYNLDNKKTKVNASYFYNETSRNLDQFSSRRTFLQDSSFANTDTTALNDFRGAHSLSTRFEHDIDSTNKIIAKANFRFVRSDDLNLQAQRFFNSADLPFNQLNIDNLSNQDNWTLSSALIFRHRFKKPGRSFALSAGYNENRTNGQDELFSLNKFFEANTFSQQVEQLNTNDQNGRQIKSSALYTQPFSKTIFWETFYNFSTSRDEVNRQVVDRALNNETIQDLSVYYLNDILYNRAGTSLRYSKDGFNLAVGLAAQRIQLDGSYARDKGQPTIGDPVSQQFDNLTPHAELSLELPNNIWLNTDYNYEVDAPSFNNLQPVPNVNNPAFRIEGNPDLGPTRRHNVSFNMNHWNPANFMSIGFGGGLNFYDQQIVYNQTVEYIDSIGIRTTTRPDNVDGGYSHYGYMWSNFPIIKTKLTLNVNGNFDLGKAPALVNNIENTTQNSSVGIGTGLNLTLNQNLQFSISGGFDLDQIRYSIQSEQNQDIINRRAGSSIKWQFIDRTFFESNFDYTLFRNERFGFDREITIWNASVRRLLGPKNKFEVRLAAFDLLNQRVNIVQRGTQNYVFTSVAPTLARYFMLSLSYNMRGYETSVKKSGWW